MQCATNRSNSRNDINNDENSDQPESIPTSDGEEDIALLKENVRGYLMLNPTFFISDEPLTMRETVQMQMFQ